MLLNLNLSLSSPHSHPSEKTVIFGSKLYCKDSTSSISTRLRNMEELTPFVYVPAEGLGRTDLTMIIGGQRLGAVGRCFEAYYGKTEDSDVTVFVGPEKREFKLHKMVLCDRSEYFRAALQDFWPEGREGRVTLPDIDPDIFAEILKWIYTLPLEIQIGTPDRGKDAILSYLDVSDYLQLADFERKLLHQVALLISEDRFPKIRERFQGYKGAPVWLEQPLDFMNDLCTTRSFHNWKELVHCAFEAINAKHRYRGTEPHMQEEISELWQWCYITALEIMVDHPHEPVNCYSPLEEAWKPPQPITR